MGADKPRDARVAWHSPNVLKSEAGCGFAGSPTSVNKIESVVLAGGEFKEVAATDEGIGALVSELIKDHTIG